MGQRSRRSKNNVKCQHRQKEESNQGDHRLNFFSIIHQVQAYDCERQRGKRCKCSQKTQGVYGSMDNPQSANTPFFHLVRLWSQLKTSVTGFRHNASPKTSSTTYISPLDAEVRNIPAAGYRPAASPCESVSVDRLRLSGIRQSADFEKARQILPELERCTSY